MTKLIEKTMESESEDMGHESGEVHHQVVRVVTDYTTSAPILSREDVEVGSRHGKKYQLWPYRLPTGRSGVRSQGKGRRRYPNSTSCPDRMKSLLSPTCCPIPCMDQFKWQVLLTTLLLAFIALLLIQAIFLFWLVCCTTCIYCSFCEPDEGCCCHDGSGRCGRGVQVKCEQLPQQMYFVSERRGYPTDRGGHYRQENNDPSELSSLSSNDLGSDSEFEALLKRKPLPKWKRKDGYRKDT